jgi:hypothetical protein
MKSSARFLLLLPAALAMPAFAQTPPATAPATAPAPAEPVSREVYRACLNEGDRVAEAKLNLDTRREAQSAKLAALVEEGNARTAEQATLKTDDEKAVAAFNEKIKDLNERTDAANNQNAVINNERDAYNAQVVDFNKRCGSLVVRTADKEAVMQERAAAKAKK